ncbi:MAG: insulinase family protein [Candidatus Eremiobacteraeota bacterium]|nr:insulinase family protein [Candidatus Eremiobacteraeota bacterium]
MNKKPRTIFPTKKEELPNGITLLLRENHSVPTISITVYFKGGKGIENEKTNGISCLTQRLMTRGAGEYSTLSLYEQLEKYGIRINPFFGKDTAGITMMTLSRHFDRAMELFSQVILNPKFPEEELEKEKKNLIEGIHKEKDDILPYCLQKCEGLVFEGHPYSMPRKGTEESVKKFTREDVLKYYQDVYFPANMVVSIVGDIQMDYALSVLSRYFNGFNSSSSLLDPGDIENPIKNVREGIEQTEKRQVALCIGFQAPSVVSEDYYTFSVLNHVLSGMGSRLFVELRDKQALAYSVNSIFSSYKNAGIFRAYILTGYDQKERARMSLLEEIDRLRTRLVSYDELVRAKRYHLGLFDIRLQSNSSVASQLAYHEIMNNGYDFIDKYPERIKLITRQKVKRAAEKYLKPQSYAIAILTPGSYPGNLR